MSSADDLSALKEALPAMGSMPAVSPAMAEALGAPDIENSVDGKNGGTAGWGRWEQSKDEVTAFIELPKGTRGRELQARLSLPIVTRMHTASRARAYSDARAPKCACLRFASRRRQCTCRTEALS